MSGTAQPAGWLGNYSRGPDTSPIEKESDKVPLENDVSPSPPVVTVVEESSKLAIEESDRVCPIDFLVGAYGFLDDTDTVVIEFLTKLKEKCNLDNVNVFCAEREHRPVGEALRNTIQTMGFHLLHCPLPPSSNCREDTSNFCNWMVDNASIAPWIIMSHFDVVFKGDYIEYVRSMMATTDMVGDHHNGIMAIRRESYDQCQVGFCGIDDYVIYKNGSGQFGILPRGAPCGGVDAGIALAIDVGGLLSLRVAAIGLRHVWTTRGNVTGKSDLFVHTRRGSGHGGRPRDNDT